MESPLSFPKSRRLRKRKEFLSFQKSSRKVGSLLCLDRAPSNSPFSRLGITASRKFGNAVERNRFKRLAREAFRSLAQELASPLILHVLPRQKAKDAGMSSIRKELLDLLYCAREDFVNLDSARQCQIEASRSERRNSSPRGQGEEEDRFGAVAASPNSRNLPVRSIHS